MCSPSVSSCWTAPYYRGMGLLWQYLCRHKLGVFMRNLRNNNVFVFILSNTDGRFWLIKSSIITRLSWAIISDWLSKSTDWCSCCVSWTWDDLISKISSFACFSLLSVLMFFFSTNPRYRISKVLSMTWWRARSLFTLVADWVFSSS